jgi:hypothetical protein
MNILRRTFVQFGGLVSNLISAPSGRHWRMGQASVGIFQDLRATSMTKKREIAGGNPPSGRENPELPCLVLFTPRKTDMKEIRREKTQQRRISHGIARAIEDLRRVWMSLVPCPDSRYRLLPGV